MPRTGGCCTYTTASWTRLEDLIEGANGKPVLMAYWFKHDLARIQKRFDVREIKSSRDIADWNAGRIPVAAIHPASAGHGINLQAGGSTLIWFGLTWSLELYQQTNARLWRQGQQSDTVVIHHIITTGTIDEQIMAALERKDRTQSALIDAGESEPGGGRMDGKGVSLSGTASGRAHKRQAAPGGTAAAHGRKGHGDARRHSEFRNDQRLQPAGHDLSDSRSGSGDKHGVSDQLIELRREIMHAIDSRAKRRVSDAAIDAISELQVVAGDRGWHGI